MPRVLESEVKSHELTMYEAGDNSIKVSVLQSVTADFSPIYRRKTRIMLIYMQRLRYSLRIQVLGTKSNLPRHVLVLLVVVQANYQITLTYLQCKVLTAERNMEILVATADICQ